MRVAGVEDDRIAGDLARLRLMQLSSAALPIGAFAYSQGLEHAAVLGWVRDESSAFDWLSGVLSQCLSSLDGPVLLRMHDCFVRNETDPALGWSRFLLAARESAELEAEDRQVGSSLARVLTGHGVAEAEAWMGSRDVTYAAMFALGTARASIDRNQALTGYFFAWAEAQVGALCRLLPFGQIAAQRVLSRVLSEIPAAVDQASCLFDEEIGSLAPGLALASALHERQYSRLFRS